MNDDDLFEQDDPFAHPAWKEMKKPTRRRMRNARHVGCSIEWLRWVASLLNSKEQLLAALLVSRRCYICNSKTVAIPTTDFEEVGIGRRSKIRHLQALEQAGLLTIEPRDGRTIQVTLTYWPSPPSISTS